MKPAVLPPRLGLVFALSSVLAIVIAYLVERHETLVARAEIAFSHRVTAHLVGRTVENADHTIYGRPANTRVQAQRHRLQLEFTDADGQRRQAELEWLEVTSRNGLPVRRAPPWLGEIDAMDRHPPTVIVYQRISDPSRVRWATPLDELALGSPTDPQADAFDLGHTLTFAFLVGLLASLLYGAGHRLWRAFR
jgi:hypothetical protein